MAQPKFRVAIVGGGMGGVAFAVALSKQPNIQFDLYESARRFEEIGAGAVLSFFLLTCAA